MGLAQSLPRRQEYPRFFRDNIGRNLTYVLEQFSSDEWIVVSREQRQQVSHILTYALRLPELWPQTRDLIVILAEPMERAGQREGWASKIDAAIEQSALYGDHAARSDLLYYRGVLHARQGNDQEGHRLLESALHALDQTSDDPSRRQRILSRLAFTVRRHDRGAAAEWIRRAQAVEGSNLEERAYTELVLGTLALERLEPAKAVEHYARGLELARAAQNPHLIGWLIVNLAVGYRSDKRPDEAIETYLRAIEHFTDFEDPLALANARQNLGAVYHDVGKYERAIAQLNAGESVYRRIGDTLQLARATLALANVSQALEQHEQAEAYYEESTLLATQAGSPATLIWALCGRAHSNAALGRVDRAQGYLRQAEESLRTLEGEPVYPRLDAEIRKVRRGIDGAGDGGAPEAH